MQCPFCNHERDRVVDSRESRERSAIRRRRECMSCGRRFTTYERIEDIPYMVIKKEGHREPFERPKILRGLLRACEKRPVSPQQLEELVDSVEKHLMDSPDREISSIEIGQLVMSRLRQLDKVAYIRFASVYLDFKTVQEFMDELSQLVQSN
ncbi:MAG: transcriptional repressor NrdR [Acidobacteriota bacterium]|nr:MAG: transcriptional repressor NrdR [Acidobacteriota bacterium]